MLRLSKGLCAVVGALMLLAAPTIVNAQEDCHRGTLDVAYCDRNLDQLADLPTDPKDWVDPSTIIFTYTPVEDPAVYASIWQGFVDHYSAKGNAKIQLDATIYTGNNDTKQKAVTFTGSYGLLGAY